jgi:UDP-N-acetylmuramate dehydrogenase
MSLADLISQLPDCEFLPQADLTAYTTMRLGSTGDLLKVRSIPALQKLLPLLISQGRKYLVLGWGANQILPPHCSEVVILLDFPFEADYLNQLRQEYVLPASLGLNHLTAHASRFGLAGWDVFTGIPASLGGAVFMNAGTNLGEIGAVVKSVRLVTPEGKLREHVIGPGSFSYRHNHFVAPGEVIVEVTMTHLGQIEGLGQKIKSYLDYRKSSQPLATRNCGCVFKNPAKELPAGKLIDLLQLKGVQSGELRISPKHGNFVENLGKGEWAHLESLIEMVRFQADHFYGIEFELEVKIPYH